MKKETLGPFSPVQNNGMEGSLWSSVGRRMCYSCCSISWKLGGTGGAMHSPVAHVLYLCSPKMKHLCGDEFLLRHLIKSSKISRSVFSISLYAKLLVKITGENKVLNTNIQNKPIMEQDS